MKKVISTILGCLFFAYLGFFIASHQTVTIYQGERFKEGDKYILEKECTIVWKDLPIVVPRYRTPNPFRKIVFNSDTSFFIPIGTKLEIRTFTKDSVFFTLVEEGRSNNRPKQANNYSISLAVEELEGVFGVSFCDALKIKKVSQFFN